MALIYFQRIVSEPLLQLMNTSKGFLFLKKEKKKIVLIDKTLIKFLKIFRWHKEERLFV